MTDLDPFEDFESMIQCDNCREPVGDDMLVECPDCGSSVCESCFDDTLGVCIDCADES